MKTNVLVISAVLLILLLGCTQQYNQQSPSPSMNNTPTQPSQPAQSGSGGMMNNSGTMMNESGMMNGSGTMMNESGSTNGTMMNSSGEMNGSMMNNSGMMNGSGNMNNSGTMMNESGMMNETTSPSVYNIKANDLSYMMSGNSVSSLTVKKGMMVTIVFTIDTQNVYHGGLDFRGCGQSVLGTPPGQSVDFNITPTSSCAITSYWPSTGVSKQTLNIQVQ